MSELRCRQRMQHARETLNKQFREINLAIDLGEYNTALALLYGCVQLVESMIREGPNNG